MAKQTSRMYGIKVKEKVNYYEFGANDGFITLFYLSDIGSGAWQIKAGKHDGTNPKSDVEWWYNGRQYSAGDTIETFNDGDIVTFHILESHVDTTPYVNYMYDIYGNAGENIEYGNKEVFYRILPSPVSQYACKVYMFENGMVKSTKEFTSEDIVKYKQTYSQIVDNPLYPVYNMLFDWHGADPHSGYPQMSFQAISNSNYIKYNGNTISKNETIKTWQAIGFTGFEVKDDTNKYTAQKKTAEALPIVQLCKRIGGAFICQATKDKKNIFSDVFHDHKDVYYNGHYHKAMYLVYDNPGVDGCWKRNVGSLALTYAYPYWFLMSIKAGIEYGGRTYEARKLIRSWKPSDSVDMTLKEKESRAKENNKDINKVVYDITKTANVDSITVIMQEIDDNRQYTDLDTRTFTSAESPVTFHNIQFKFETTKWTIISKCGYIRYNGRTYPNNRTILSFNLDEDVHIEIGDETNKYFVETEITYIVKTPNTDVSAIYSVHTSEMEKTLKLVKQIGDKEEPWVTVRFYEAMYIPVEYDDISVRFDNTAMKWELYSNSDNLYHDGTNYKKGTLLSEWPYNVFAKIGNIVVTHENHEALEVTKIEKSNTNKVSNQNIDEDIGWHKADSIDFHISYNYTNSVWTLRSVKDCWMNGIHLMNGDIIKQWKTGSFVDEFTFLFAYHDDEDHPELITNVIYHVSAAVDFKKVTTVSVSLYGHPTESFSDKDISKGSETNFLFTKQDARSMYGYIWQKEEEPPVPTWDIFDFIVFRDDYWNTRYVRIKVENNELVWEHGTLLSWAAYAYCYGLGLFNNVYLNECYLSNGYNGYKITFNEYGDPQLTTYNNFYRLPLRTSNYDGYPMIGIISNGTSIALKLTQETTDPYDWYVDKYIANTTNDILIEQHIRLTDMYGISVFNDPNNIKTYLINNKLYFISNDSSLMTILIADESYTHLYNYGYDNFMWDLQDTIRNQYPMGEGGYNFATSAHSIDCDQGASFEHNGYIYKFIQYCINIIDYDYDKCIWKPGFIKINAENGSWQFLSLNDTQFWSDALETPADHDGTISIKVVESDNQIYLYAIFSKEYDSSSTYYQSSVLYIYRVDFTNGLEINRLNYFDGTQGHDYVEFKYDSETARCYPMSGNLQYDGNLGYYVFGLDAGRSINRMNYSESNMFCDITAKYSGGLLSNLGKGNYAIGKLQGSTTTIFIAKLHSLDLIPSPENEVFTVGQFS